jgi:stearoyl-CoA desaturase (Delta-9 desaturase)
VPHIVTTATPTATPGAKPVFDQPKPRHEQLLIGAFTILPMLALIAAVPLAWGLQVIQGSDDRQG